MEAYQELESELAKWSGYPSENMVVCSSGSAALHLALEAMRATGSLLPKSEVLIPDYTMIACARAVTMADMVPVLVDCGNDLLIDSDMCEALLRFSTAKALMAVHIYGRRYSMSRLADVAAKKDLLLIEDLAEAHGVKPHYRTDAACWSFYRNKIVAGEEGGAVAFRNPAHAKAARILRSLGFSDRHDFYHMPRGCNYRLANCLASLVLRSLGHFNATCQVRRMIEQSYEKYCPIDWRQPYRDAVWVFDLRIPGMRAGAQQLVIEALNRNGIAARHGFKPIHKQPEYESCKVARVGKGLAETAATEVIYLPCDIADLNTPWATSLPFDIIRSVLAGGD